MDRNGIITQGLFKLLGIVGLISLVTTLSAQPDHSIEIITKFEEPLARVVTLHEVVKDIHPYLSELYPIVIANLQRFYLFAHDTSTNQYKYVKTSPAPYPIYKGVRAAMPVEINDWDPACVITSEALTKIDDFAVVFHEFVHCAQWHDVENQLKESLGIYRRAMEENDYAWELDYPFPYQDSVVVVMYSEWLELLKNGYINGATAKRHALVDRLSTGEYEYMVWQEWKEGFARLIQNKVRERLNLAPIPAEIGRMFARTAFYSGGEQLIQALVAKRPSHFTETNALFMEMMGARQRAAR